MVLEILYNYWGTWLIRHLVNKYLNFMARELKGFRAKQSMVFLPFHFYCAMEISGTISSSWGGSHLPAAPPSPLKVCSETCGYHPKLLLFRPVTISCLFCDLFLFTFTFKASTSSLVLWVQEVVSKVPPSHFIHPVENAAFRGLKTRMSWLNT